MKGIILVALLTSIFSNAFPQKPPIDYKDIENFPDINSPIISDNGKYVSYAISQGNTSTLVIQSIDGSFKKEVSGFPTYYRNYRFIDNHFVYLTPGDTISFLNLNTKKENLIPKCLSFEVHDETGTPWVAYLKDKEHLVAYNLTTGNERHFNNVVEYRFVPQHEALFLKTYLDSNTYKLEYTNLGTGSSHTIWKGANSAWYTFDESGTKLAFSTSGPNKSTEIWYADLKNYSPVLLVDETTAGLNPNMTIRDGLLKFSNKGDKVFFYVYTKEIPPPGPNASDNVDIWSSKDQFLQGQQLTELSIYKDRPYLAVSLIKTKRVIQLEDENVSIGSILSSGANNDYLLINLISNMWEAPFRPDEVQRTFLISTETGNRQLVKEMRYTTHYKFSPSGKYVYWYDREKKAYFSYRTKDNLIKNISKSINLPIPYGTAMWAKDDDWLLIYDKYDIWKIDPSGLKDTENITREYGKKNSIILRCCNESNQTERSIVKDNATLILCGFEETTKRNGFYKLKLNERNIPYKLNMSPSVYYFPDNISFVRFPSLLIKAKKADVFLLTRESATEYPNLVTTKTFESFDEITDLAPHRKYNWLTAELIHYQTMDGRPGIGILYKPENFDSSNKYPVILHFYEELSHGLNKYIKPKLSRGAINIPFYVSHGYVVFCPDIFYDCDGHSHGKTGANAYNYVVSAANYLSQQPFVDRLRMGIQGHSFGAYAVDYLVTHTNIFAAAAAAAGITDYISGSGIPMGGGIDWHVHVERAQSRMGASLWDNPTAYIDNSPIFSANRIETPLLIMHNKKDGVIDWSSQGLSFFTGLRRLKKTVWMLQYDNCGHDLGESKADQLDYSQRLFQFFDHYLRGSVPPMWMTKGRPARLKGIDSKMEPDPNGYCSEQCKICSERKIKSQ